LTKSTISQSQEISSNKNQRNYLIILVIIVFIILMVVLFLYRERKKAALEILKAKELAEKAKEAQGTTPLNIDYSVASATELPFENASFDFATSFMCLMDIPNPEKALQEAYRVLKPNGFLQFSITHPCFNTPHRKNLRRLNGKTYAIEVGNYFKNQDGKIEEWIFGAAPASLKNKFSKFKIPIFNRTLTQWFNDILESGFMIEQVNEPYPGNDVVKSEPYLQDAQITAYFLHIRCRKNSQ